MINRNISVAFGLLLVTPGLLSAQVSTCQVQTEDACQKGRDIYTYLFPQLGAGLAAGNPLLGSTGALGGLGHFSAGVRVSFLNASLPDFDDIPVSLGGRESNDIPLIKQWTPVPVFDAAVGLFKGIPVGVTHIGAVDALASLTYVPDVIEDIDVELEGNTRFGFGVRVGLLEESIVVPAITVSYLQRGLPELSFNTNANTPATFSVRNLDVAVSSWRLMASKNFIAFGLAAGIGGDTYDSDGTLRASAGGSTVGIDLTRSMTRSNWFVDLTINLGPVRLAGEYGGVASKTLETFNTFDPAAGASRNYFSTGLRVAF
jgi:hypothetical protein